ncbi:MAG: hypothetical protein ACI8QS_003127 [Planctomycetota bacterium]|jgi:hypothetical protein
MPSKTRAKCPVRLLQIELREAAPVFLQGVPRFLQADVSLGACATLESFVSQNGGDRGMACVATTEKGSTVEWFA